MYFPQGGAYEQMIAFVRDDAARTEEHAMLIQGLEKLDHVADVVVVSRPAKMRHDRGAEPNLAAPLRDHFRQGRGAGSAGARGWRARISLGGSL